MASFSDNSVLIAASYYTRRVFISPGLSPLPARVRRELKAAAALAAEKARGILVVACRRSDIAVRIEREDDDVGFDEINAKSAVSLFLDNQKENLAGLRLYLQAIRRA